MEIKRDHIQSIKIDDFSDVGICRRKASSFAKELGFSDVKIGEIAIIVSEMVSNVVKHANSRGHFLMCKLKDENDHIGIETWCCDEGDGIFNQEEALKDGFSNSNTLGIGLGSIKRLSDEFEINPEKPDIIKFNLLNNIRTYNTCFRSRKWLPVNKWTGKNKSLEFGAYSREKPGEKLNGDAYLINHISADKTLVAVIDGLGHGNDANLPAQLAREQMILNIDIPIDNIMQKVHSSLKGTRGATISMAIIDTSKSVINYTGIGNIESWIISGNQKKSCISQRGIVGHNIRSPRVQKLDFNKGDYLCMFSDGITTRWDIEDLDKNNHPQKNAELIMDKYSKINDDASILIVRYTP